MLDPKRRMVPVITTACTVFSARASYLLQFTGKTCKLATKKVDARRKYIVPTSGSKILHASLGVCDLNGGRDKCSDELGIVQ